MNENISVVIIAKNEEERIRRCLESVKDLADEIIVVDDFSTDKTVEIVQSLGAKVFRRNLDNNFSAQRNFGIEKANNEWILFLDADEFIPLDLKKEIQSRLGKENYVAYLIEIRNYFYGHLLRYAGIKGYKLRLFKKGYAWYESDVHEELIVKGPIGKMKNFFIHYIPESIDKLFLKSLKYAEIQANNYLKDREVSSKEIKYRLTWKALKLFWKLYIKKKGYKDGMYGLVWAILNVIGPEIIWLKIWEKVINKNNK